MEEKKNYLRILSLNVNGFAGCGDVTKGPWVKQQEVLNKLLKIEEPDIIFLSEFNIKLEENEKFIDNLCDAGYCKVLPDGKKYSKEFATKHSFVIAFVKEEVTSKRNEWLRWNEFLYQGYRIVGVHVPWYECRKDATEEFWEIMLNHYEEHKNEKVIYIGDMNVFIKETDGQKLQQKLLDRGMFDAWLKKGGTHDNKEAMTYKGVTRVDYALLSPSAAACLTHIENLQDFYKDKASDHSAILIDLKLEEE